MRDDKDPGTLDMHPPKRGRPCLDNEKGPMTAAEKQRRYRQRRASQANLCGRMTRVSVAGALAEFTDMALLDAIRSERSFLAALVEQGRGGTAPSSKRIGALVAELARRYPEK